MYEDILEYIKSIQDSNICLSVVLGILFSVMFPEPSYFAAAAAVLGLAIIDLITKYHAIARQNGGLFKAFTNNKIDVDMMWRGTSRKLFTYLVLFILTGLSYRVVTITTVSVLLSNTVYAMLFFREAQSILRNMLEAGFDVEWLLCIVARKQKKFEEELEKDDKPK